MSRVGKLPIGLPAGVTITVDESNTGDGQGRGTITVAGTKGTLTQFAMPDITVKQEESEIVVTRANDEPKVRAKHGLMRALLNNMVVGVSTGFSKQLELNGVGFRWSTAGQDIKMSLGFSHEVTYHLPQGISATVEQNKLTVTGIDKQQVGQVAAEIRALKKPEPYKGKGIKYANERIIRKSGKSGKDK